MRNVVGPVRAAALSENAPTQMRQPFLFSIFFYHRFTENTTVAEAKRTGETDACCKQQMFAARAEASGVSSNSPPPSSNGDTVLTFSKGVKAL